MSLSNPPSGSPSPSRDNTDELKYRTEKALYDLFYKGMNAGEDEVLQRQFDMELGYKHRYADRCIKDAKNEIADMLTTVIDLGAWDLDALKRLQESAQDGPDKPNRRNTCE